MLTTLTFPMHFIQSYWSSLWHGSRQEASDEPASMCTSYMMKISSRPVSVISETNSNTTVTHNESWTFMAISYNTQTKNTEICKRYTVYLTAQTSQISGSFFSMYRWYKNYQVTCAQLFGWEYIWDKPGYTSMMTSSNENIFHVTGPLCGEFTGHRWIPLTKASDAELWCFYDLCLNKRLSKQSWGWWIETPPCSLWRHCNVTGCAGHRWLCHVYVVYLEVYYIYALEFKTICVGDITCSDTG